MQLRDANPSKETTTKERAGPKTRSVTAQEICTLRNGKEFSAPTATTPEPKSSPLSAKGTDDNVTIPYLKTVKARNYTDNHKDTGPMKTFCNEGRNKEAAVRLTYGEVRTEVTISSATHKSTKGIASFQKKKLAAICKACTTAKRLISEKLAKNYSCNDMLCCKKFVENIMYVSNTHLVCAFKEYLIYDDTNEFLKRLYHKAELSLRLHTLYAYYKKYGNVRPNYAILQERNILVSNIATKKLCAKSKQRKVTSEKVDNAEENNLFTSAFFKELDQDDRNVSIRMNGLSTELKDAIPITKMQSYLKSQSSYKKEERKQCESCVSHKRQDTLPKLISKSSSKEPVEKPEKVKKIEIEKIEKVRDVDKAEKIESPEKVEKIEDLHELVRSTKELDEPKTSIQPKCKCRIVLASSPKRIVNFKLHIDPKTAQPSPPPNLNIRISKRGSVDLEMPVPTQSFINPIPALKQVEEKSIDHLSKKNGQDVDAIYPLAVKLHTNLNVEQSKMKQGSEPGPRTEKRSKRNKGLMRRKTCDDVPDSNNDLKMLCLKYGGESSGLNGRAIPVNTQNIGRNIPISKASERINALTHLPYNITPEKSQLPRVFAASIVSSNSRQFHLNAMPTHIEQLRNKRLGYDSVPRNSPVHRPQFPRRKATDLGSQKAQFSSLPSTPEGSFLTAVARLGSCEIQEHKSTFLSQRQASTELTQHMTINPVRDRNVGARRKFTPEFQQLADNRLRPSSRIRSKQ